MCRYILVKENGEYLPVKTKHILRFEADGNYVNIHLKNSKVYKGQTGNLGLWKKRVNPAGYVSNGVNKPKKFVLVNRSNLVNYKRIVFFSRTGGVVLRLCSAKKYAEILSINVTAEKDHAVFKNTLSLNLSPNGFIELMWLFYDNASVRRSPIGEKPHEESGKDNTNNNRT